MPWSINWELVKAFGGGGQGDTSIVRSRADASQTGLLKCLKKGNDPKARRRMFQEVSNLRILHGAGAKVPKVLDDNTNDFETEVPLFFVMELISGDTLSVRISETLLNLES